MEGWQKRVGDGLDLVDSTTVSLKQGRHAAAKVRPEEVLTLDEMRVLARARNGELPCPRCGQPLYGELAYYPLEDDDCYAGVRLSCSCGFVEY